MIAALLLTVIYFLTDCRATISGPDVNLHAGRTGYLTFVARDTWIGLEGFAVWRDLTPNVRDFLVMPWSAYRGSGDYFITHQHMTHQRPNAGAEITVRGGGTAVLLHGEFMVNGVHYIVDQGNYRYYPPITLDLP